MESKKIIERRISHIKREVFIGLLSSILSVFTVLPYLGVRDNWPLSKRYLELLSNPLQILFYLLVAVLILMIHAIFTGILYNIRDISPTIVKGTLINQFIYGITIIGFAFKYCSLPSRINATIVERFIDDKEVFYLTLFFILFYWIGNVIYFNSRYFKNLESI